MIKDNASEMPGTDSTLPEFPIPLLQLRKILVKFIEKSRHTWPAELSDKETSKVQYRQKSGQGLSGT